MAKVGDKYLLHSINGETFLIEIINVNDFREPDMKYGADVYDLNGEPIYDDVVFFGDELLNKCEKID